MSDGARPARSPDVPVALAVTPHGHLHLDPTPPGDHRLPAARAAAVTESFAVSAAQGLLHLGTTLLDVELPPSLAFGRELSRLFLSRLAGVADLEAERASLSLPPPEAELAVLAEAAPPMTGAEYLTQAVLEQAWAGLVAAVQGELAAFAGTARAYLAARSPAFAAAGRVHFHLAENERDERTPFAFLATYATRGSDHGRVQHAPLRRAITEYAGAGDKGQLLALLQPVQQAAERSALVKALLDSGAIFQRLAWTPREAFAFLEAAPACEASGVVVRVPDWWKKKRPPRPGVRVTVGSREPAGLGTEAMLDFDVGLSLDGEAISAVEAEQLLAGTEPLVLLKGRWVEVDREKLLEVLAHWRSVEERVTREGLSFFEGMRLLAGADVTGSLAGLAAPAAPAAGEWTQVTAGPWLEALLADLRKPDGMGAADPGDALHGSLRPYQRAGVAWLHLLARLRLGGCLADDMGLGKTIQILALLLVLEREGAAAAPRGGAGVAPRQLAGGGGPLRAEPARPRGAPLGDGPTPSSAGAGRDGRSPSTWC